MPLCLRLVAKNIMLHSRRAQTLYCAPRSKNKVLLASLLSVNTCAKDVVIGGPRVAHLTNYFETTRDTQSNCKRSLTIETMRAACWASRFPWIFPISTWVRQKTNNHEQARLTSRWRRSWCWRPYSCRLHLSGQRHSPSGHSTKPCAESSPGLGLYP